MIALNEIVTALTHQQNPLPDHPISSVVIDSRQAQPGSLFIALPGEKVNGHDYVDSAFENGADLALIDQAYQGQASVLDLRPGQFGDLEADLNFPLCLLVDDTLTALQALATWWREAHPVRTIGITGSVGKTSTKEIIAAVLSYRFDVLKNPGNRNNEIGLPLTLLDLEPHHKRAVLEMGFYVPGEIRTLCQIAHPHVGVVTNIGTVHAERAGSQKIIAEGKAELVESLPPAPEGVAILNKDDPWVRSMAEKTRGRIFFYGLDQDADLSASEIKSQGLNGVSCTLHYQGKSHPIQSPLLGAFSVYTILRAAGVALVEGLNWETITEALAASQVTLRMTQRKLQNGVIILDDTYNASPASTAAALELLNDLQGRKVAILGDMLELGQYEQAGHQKIGAAAAACADLIILVGERTKISAEAALENGFSKENIIWFPDSTAAAHPVTEQVQKGDVVLVKGSNSMHMDQIINALEKLSGGPH